MPNDLIKADCGVIGAGLAGAAVALELADAGKKVALFIKNKLTEDCSSYLLAGGLTAVKIPNFTNDSFDLHVKETLAAGKGLNDEKIVKYCAEHFYSDVIEWLIKRGIKFDLQDGEFDLHREGGHSKNRIFHIKDTTGKTIMETLRNLIINHPNITIYENHMVIDLITKDKLQEKKSGNDICFGFYVYDITNDYVKTVECEATFVATGGLGKTFLYTSNPDVATGDGFAMCYRRGLPLANMEFIQFHPTVFYDPSATNETERRFLLTEALRGAGAILKLSMNSSEDFVLKYDPMGSKATRDVVSRAEDIEMRKNGLSHVWLDCTKIDKERLKNDFKNSYEFCKKHGYDITKEPVPVVYAEHYSNGGVLVGKNSETEINGCYVLGETSYTGLHGATRLASNSGPECILFAELAAKHFLSQTKSPESIKIPLWRTGSAKESRDKITVGYYWEVVRRTMNALCGMSRSKERLVAALDIIKSLEKSIKEYYWSYKVTKDFLEVRNIVEVAHVIIESALLREESRACHFREDFPKENNKYLNLTLVQKLNIGS
ncbi:L-aspartate oxidase [uncultured archaeon]|nr:L-aspartate oxidase [uncultured archaeon]